MGIFNLYLQSSSPVSFLWVLLVLLLVYHISSSLITQKDRKEPPGPKPLPLVGNLLQLDLKRPYDTYLKLSKKYGSVFTVHMGPQKVVVLVGYKTVKEALINYAEEFGDRDATPIIRESNQGQGIIWSNGDSWKEMRRFSLTNLKDFGMGKKAFEDKIIEESHHLIEVLKEFKGEAFDTSQPVYHAISNIICSLVFGNRFEYSDPEFTSLVNSTGRRIELLTSRAIQLYNTFPWFYKWSTSRKEFLALSAAIRKHTTELCSHLKKTLNPQMCRGFVDAFLVQKQNLEESGVTDSDFHNENLLQSVMNLFSAGTDTTTTTLRWGLLLMAKYPKIQDQVQEELSRVVGRRQVQIEDRKNLPFTNAVIHETQRLANIAPTSLPHKTSQDVTFQGHFIKKGTTVFPILASVLFDESEWERPHTFHPAHFLDQDGKFVRREAFMPFSAGRRACPGESLARMELFIFFSSLMQNFRFTLPAGASVDDLDLTPFLSANQRFSPHKLCAVLRM
ncbi:uncharacterized protein V6R79_026432 [Siganus canaliculatus]